MKTSKRVGNTMSEELKHWNKIKFYAEKWREHEKKARDIHLQIIKLQVEKERLEKEAKSYATKCRGTILLEVI